MTGAGRHAVIDTDEALRCLGRSGWTLVAYGDRAEPDCLVAWKRLDDHADVLIMDTEQRSAAYRAPLWPDQDPLDARMVTWCYLGHIGAVLRNLLALPPIDRAWPAYEMPPEVPLPGLGVRTVTLRLPQ
jgi:hypothetical protein